MNMEKVEFEVGLHGEQIKDLYEKVGGLASLPDKVDTQTEILRNIAKDLSAIPEHKAQLAVLCEIITDYKEHKKKCVADKIDPVQVKEDHDKVTKMSAEWVLVKYAIPISVTIINIIVGVVLHFGNRS